MPRRSSVQSHPRCITQLLYLECVIAELFLLIFIFILIFYSEGFNLLSMGPSTVWASVLKHVPTESCRLCVLGHEPICPWEGRVCLCKSVSTQVIHTPLCTHDTAIYIFHTRIRAMHTSTYVQPLRARFRRHSQIEQCNFSADFD